MPLTEWVERCEKAGQPPVPPGVAARALLVVTDTSGEVSYWHIDTTRGDCGLKPGLPDGPPHIELRGPARVFDALFRGKVGEGVWAVLCGDLVVVNRAKRMPLSVPSSWAEKVRDTQVS
jgi:hypothetical protein